MCTVHINIRRVSSFEPSESFSSGSSANHMAILEIIPKFTCLLNRQQPIVLHGDGSPTRRYLYAGDAADAFDTILHRGQLGQIYNVGSNDEVSNLNLCRMILSTMSIEHSQPDDFRRWVKYTHDRPYNDRRYAVDDTKLKALGWTQRTGIEQGLRTTVDWYRTFGERWWGDITHVLTPFPVLSQEGEVVPDFEHLVRDEPPAPGDDCHKKGGGGGGRRRESSCSLNRRSLGLDRDS
jgi:hypothetical protein